MRDAWKRLKSEIIIFDRVWLRRRLIYTRILCIYVCYIFYCPSAIIIIIINTIFQYITLYLMLSSGRIEIRVLYAGRVKNKRFYVYILLAIGFFSLTHSFATYPRIMQMQIYNIYVYSIYSLVGLPWFWFVSYIIHI